MKVLHFIPNLDTEVGSNIFRYKPDLFGNMSERAEVHILTLYKPFETPGTATVHVCLSADLIYLNKRSALARQLLEINPDVVHIHAGWNFAAYMLQHWCVKNRKPVVISLDKRLEPWHIRRHSPVNLIKFVLFQRYMLRHADAIHSVSEQESKRLLRLGFPLKLVSRATLNDRIGEVRIFNQTATMTAEDMSAAMIRLYRKVLDSRPFLSMTATDRHAEDMLLVIGAAKGREELSFSEQEIADVRALDLNSWRRILLHAADQGILDMVESGCSQYNLSLPPVDVKNAERFTYCGEAKDRGEKTFRERKTAMLKADKQLSGTELDICIKIVDVLAKAKSMRIKRADLSDMYQTLRFNDYDETLTADKIHKLKIDRPTSRLFEILKERYGLGEGFMFLEPLSDRKTKQLIKNLFKSDIQ